MNIIFRGSKTKLGPRITKGWVSKGFDWGRVSRKEELHSFKEELQKGSLVTIPGGANILGKIFWPLLLFIYLCWRLQGVTNFQGRNHSHSLLEGRPISRFNSVGLSPRQESGYSPFSASHKTLGAPFARTRMLKHNSFCDKIYLSPTRSGVN